MESHTSGRQGRLPEVCASGAYQVPHQGHLRPQAFLF